MICAHCNGTGSLSQQLRGYLDCVHCDVAESRVKLESWAAESGLKCNSVELFLIYQQGLIAGLSASSA